RNEGRRFTRFLSILPHPIRKRAALGKLHAVERRTILFADSVNWQNTFMLKTRRSFRFDTKPLHRVRRADIGRQNHLQRDNTRWHMLPRAIDNPHPAVRHLIQQLVILNAARADWLFRLPLCDRCCQQTRRAEASRQLSVQSCPAALAYFACRTRRHNQNACSRTRANTARSRRSSSSTSCGALTVCMISRRTAVANWRRKRYISVVTAPSPMFIWSAIS